MLPPSPSEVQPDVIVNIPPHPPSPPPPSPPLLMTITPLTQDTLKLHTRLMEEKYIAQVTHDQAMALANLYSSNMQNELRNITDPLDNVSQSKLDIL